jgi:hypothetical protein
MESLSRFGNSLPLQNSSLQEFPDSRPARHQELAQSIAAVA